MTVLLQEFRQVEAGESFGSGIGLPDLPVQQRRPELIPLLLGKTAFSSDFSMVIRGVIKPLLAMGQAMAPLIDDDTGGARQVIKQRCRL